MRLARDVTRFLSTVLCQHKQQSRQRNRRLCLVPHTMQVWEKHFWGGQTVRRPESNDLYSSPFVTGSDVMRVTCRAGAEAVIYIKRGLLRQRLARTSSQARGR